jgi:hypothetical protein
MPQVWATDKAAKGDEPKRYHVEQTETWPVAQQVRDYIAKRVDSERWQIEASYATPSTEPKWDATKHMTRESPNVPGDGVDAESVTPRPNGPVTI